MNLLTIIQLRLDKNYYDTMIELKEIFTPDAFDARIKRDRSQWKK